MPLLTELWIEGEIKQKLLKMVSLSIVLLSKEELWKFDNSISHG